MTFCRKHDTRCTERYGFFTAVQNCPPDCHCPIYVRWFNSKTGHAVKRSVKTRDLDTAKALIADAGVEEAIAAYKEGTSFPLNLFRTKAQAHAQGLHLMALEELKHTPDIGLRHKASLETLKGTGAMRSAQVGGTYIQNNNLILGMNDQELQEFIEQGERAEQLDTGSHSRQLESGESGTGEEEDSGQDLPRPALVVEGVYEDA